LTDKGLVEYFYSDDYARDIPLGKKVQLAEDFGDLVKAMRSGYESSFSPGDFKEAIGRFEGRFAGNEQQDAQELLNYLLQGLHQDLEKDRPDVPNLDNPAEVCQLVRLGKVRLD
jgi:ubiquitin carboxyl-terminal hydrolase 4/11/15